MLNIIVNYFFIILTPLMMNCIINEIIEEWKIYCKSMTNQDLFEKVRRILYRSYINKKRQATFGSIKRRCSIKTLGSDEKVQVDRTKKNIKKQTATKKVKKLVKKQKNFETIKSKKAKSCDEDSKVENALDIIMGEKQLIENDNDNVEKNEYNNRVKINDNQKCAEIIDSKNYVYNLNELETPAHENNFIEEMKIEKPKIKKTTRSKKNPVVFRRNNKKQIKKNITANNINEKLEFIKLGRKSVDRLNDKIQNEENLRSGNVLNSKNVANHEKENLNDQIECNNTEKIYTNVKLDDEILKINDVFENPKKVNIKKEVIIETIKLPCKKIFSKALNQQSFDDKTNSTKFSSDIVCNDKDQILQKNIISDISKTKPLKIKDIKKENDLLKKLFKKEKSKLEVKRNSVFLENKKDDLDVDKIIKKVFKKDKFIKSPIKQEFATKVDLKLITETKKKSNLSPLDIEKNINELKLENKLTLELTKNNKISQIVNENNKIYDVKSSKYIRDSPRSKNDLYKKVIDSQRKGISQNEYKSSTVIPHIRSDDEDSLLFIEPEYCKDANLTNIICKQDHEVLEEYFNLCNDINVEEIFPNIKDISNDSPNKWM